MTQDENLLTISTAILSASVLSLNFQVDRQYRQANSTELPPNEVASLCESHNFDEGRPEPKNRMGGGSN
jgi:hypothetical protein